MAPMCSMTHGYSASGIILLAADFLQEALQHVGGLGVTHMCTSTQPHTKITSHIATLNLGRSLDQQFRLRCLVILFGAPPCHGT